MSFSTLDVIIIFAYLAGIAAFGILSGGKQKSTKDYFLSESAVPWWAVCIAIVATETSALTFLSLPGLAYATNFNFLQLSFGYIIGRIVVAFVFLPRYIDGNLSTAYELLGNRFGMLARRSASIVFMGTRLVADGVRLYTTAIPLALLVTGFGLLPGFGNTEIYLIALILLSSLTLVYVFLGGVRAVIWTDVAQLFIYILGALLTCMFLWKDFSGSFAMLYDDTVGLGKMEVLNWGFDLTFAEFFSKPYTLFASLIGGMFLSMASHGTDQIIVQRVLATKGVRKAQAAMIMSGVIVFFQFLLFLIVGSLLYLFYIGKTIPSNEVFAKFIIEEMPTGLSGLIIAGILAAAMSTLSGSISALSSSTMMDIYLPLRKSAISDADALRLSRRFSIAWCVVLVIVATFFIQTPQTVVELALSIASFTYGGLLGIFLLGVLFTRVRQRSAIAGFIAGIVGMTAIILFTPIAWTWYTLIGSLLTIIVGLLPEAFTRKSLS